MNGHDACSSLLLWLADHPWVLALAKGSAVLCAVALLFVLAARLRLPAAVRHALLGAGMLLALVLPLTALAPVSLWQMRVRPAGQPAVAPAIPDLPAQSVLLQVAAKPGLPGTEAGLPGTEGVPPSPEKTSGSPVPLRGRDALDPRNTHTIFSWLQLIGWLWISGATLCALPLLLAYARLVWQTAHAQPVACAKWAQLLDEAKAKAGVRHRVQLRLLPASLSSPATFGVGRFTCIALPPLAFDWTEAEIRLVLAHELAHVRRHDWLAQGMAQVMRCVYWFHPLAWWAGHRLGVEAEFACDDQVVLAGALAPDYAQCMLDLARRLPPGRGANVAASAMPFAAALPRRIKRILQPTHNRCRVTRTCAFGLALGTSAAFGLVGCVGMQRQTPDPVVVAAQAQAAQKVREGAMLLSAAKGDVLAVQGLLRAGVSVNMRDSHGWQPLHWAAKGGRFEVAKALIAAGAKASDRLSGGETPASLADEGDHRELSVYLMQRAAEDYSHEALQYALFDAVRNGNAASVKRLIAAGAKASEKDNNQMTALDWAIREKNQAMVEYLQEQILKEKP